MPKCNHRTLVTPYLISGFFSSQIAVPCPRAGWSLWGERAWTLQEALLSPRYLYFTQCQMYFECNATQFCESLDYSSFQQLVQTKEVILPIFGGVHRNPFVESKDVSKLHASHRLRQYSSPLEPYASRKHTYDSDALNAFSAILRLLKQQYYDTGVYWGIPMVDFRGALCWGPFEGRRRSGFPGWSWSGWEGRMLNTHLYCNDEKRWYYPHL
jgi:hypothetical protein